MKDKYYTPTLEELLTFIVNEKCCYTTGKSDKNVIFKIDFEKPNLVHNLREFIESNDFDQAKGYSINHKLYLLKYLDKEDIESLGFESWNDFEKRVGFSIIEAFPSYTYVKGGCKLKFFSNEKNVTIKAMDDILFSGIIKNISELKIILKQIGPIK